MKCNACAFYEAIAALPAEADAVGVCYGEPPRVMLLPGQETISARLTKAGPPQMSMQLIPMRPTVRAVDRACSLFQAIIKH